MEAAKIRLLSVRSAIIVDVPVVIAPFDDDGSVAVLMITVADDVAVTVAVPVTIVTLTNRYANTANTNPHLFRSGRHCAANASHGNNYDC